MRGCDDASATGGETNLAASMSERLQVPSTDKNAAIVKQLQEMAGGRRLAAWLADEAKAYRQVPVRPEDRHFSVVAVFDVDTSRVAYFVLVGHAFGLVSAVYNCNRRALAVSLFFLRVCFLLVSNHYDDRYAFTLEELVVEESECVQRFYKLLGIDFAVAKCPVGTVIDILGITYNFISSSLLVKAERRMAILAELRTILRTDQLEPAAAAKIKGKLQFIASHYAGRHGRTFLRAFSERQYSRGGCRALGAGLRLAILGWIRTLETGGKPRRLVGDFDNQPPDVVLFTDGSFPDPRLREDPAAPVPRVGWVSFERGAGAGGERVVFSSYCIPEATLAEWLPRRTQIHMVELFGVVLAITQRREALRGKRVLIMIDSESAEGAMVKGTSSLEDVSDLTALAWFTLQDLDAAAYIARVPTDANPADAPSRERYIELESRGALWQDPLHPPELTSRTLWRKRLEEWVSERNEPNKKDEQRQECDQTRRASLDTSGRGRQHREDKT